GLVVGLLAVGAAHVAHRGAVAVPGGTVLRGRVEAGLPGPHEHSADRIEDGGFPGPCFTGQQQSGTRNGQLVALVDGPPLVRPAAAAPWAAGGASAGPSRSAAVASSAGPSSAPSVPPAAAAPPAAPASASAWASASVSAKRGWSPRVSRSR